MASSVESLARALAAQATSVRDALAGTSWDDESVQLVVAGLYGARLLWRVAASPAQFDREAVRAVLGSTGAVLGRTLRGALSADAPAELSGVVDQVIALLAASEGAGEPGSADLLSFYEPFLHAYAPAQRRGRGVYFTPRELAAYAVRRVDEVLEQELGVAGGLAATSSTACVLDPAAGVAVFLTAVIERVHAKVSALHREQGLGEEAARAAWQRHVREALLPRLVGFEVMPVAHALAQLQVRLALASTGCVLGPTDRVELHCVDALALLAKFDADDARAQRNEHEAAALSALRRVTVIVGNPPYARRGALRDAFWDGLLSRYKAPLRGEKNLQPLADDYLRFLRLTEHVLERAPSGVAALVVNSTLLHGHLHRGVRTSLAATFPRIDVLDLGGDSKRKARDSARARDENVFPIAQGVALLLLRRGAMLTPRAPRFARLTGCRADKLRALAVMQASDHEDLSSPAPAALLVPRSGVPDEYERFVPLDELFAAHSIGAKPGDDALLVSFDAEALVPRLIAFRDAVRKDPSLARTEAARRLRDFDGELSPARIARYAYRPFDTRFVYDDPGLWTRPVRSLREHVDGQRLLLATRFAHDARFAHVFVTRLLPDVICLSNKSAVNCFAFPESALRVETVRAALGAPVERSTFFAYVYALLHAPSYRAHYASGLEQGCPRVPLLRDRAVFEALAACGERLLSLHLGEHELSDIEAPIFDEAGDCGLQAAALSRRPMRDARSSRLRVAINERNGFTIAQEAWEFRIGGYQVCHKWLIDRARAGRLLDAVEAARFADVARAATLTLQLMSDIDRHIEAVGSLASACFTVPAPALQSS